MTHKHCVACKRSKPYAEFSTGNNKCKLCRKMKAAEKRKHHQAEVAQAAIDAEVAVIKKRQHSANQRHYWLPPGRTGAERLRAFYAVG